MDELPAVMAAHESVDDGTQQPPQKRRRGDKLLPRGVSGPNKANKYVARASFKPDPESKAVQRNLGSFNSIEEAAAAVSTAEAELAAGGTPWDKAARVNEYKRGEVRRPKSQLARLPQSLIPVRASAFYPRAHCRSRCRRRRSGSRASGT